VSTPVFIATVVILVVALILFIAFLMSRLNGKISPKIQAPLLWVVIAGILFGIFGLYQPFSKELFGIAFPVLLYSVLGYTVWSHIVPRSKKEE
jgi:uncharacterized membrane protein YfcA